MQSTLTDVTELEPGEPEVVASGSALDAALRVAPYAAIWITLLLPTLRTMARGWRPVGDDASIALQAWNTFSLHAPLVGQATGAATGPGGVQTTGDPGPLEFWLLAPFVHLDPGQGVLIGSVLLCGGALSFGLYVLQKSAGPWAAAILALVITDLAIVSPFTFVDPVWNSSFASFWFLSFLAVAFAVGLGNLCYLPFLVFIGSVTIDSHLLFLPSAALTLVAAMVCGLLLQRPAGFRWLWWTLGVVVVCWVAPLGRQLFGSHPNGTALLHSVGLGSGRPVKTLSSTLGFHALARAASPKAVWATPRPIQPIGSYGDVLRNGNLVYGIVLVALVAVFVLAWRHKRTYLASLSGMTIASAIGLVVLYARVPGKLHPLFPMDQPRRVDRGDLHLDHLGLCRRDTCEKSPLGGARGKGSDEGSEDLGTGAHRDRHDRWHADCVVPVRWEWAAFGLCRHASSPEGGRDHREGSSAGRSWNGRPVLGDKLPAARRRRARVAYLLRTAGWIPGLPVGSDGLLHYPIHPDKPFIVFNEHLTVLTGFKSYSHYSLSEVFPPNSKNSKGPKIPKGLKNLKNLTPTQRKNLKNLTPTQQNHTKLKN